jgi:formylglycine-generating enzyme required for sulfatase activity/predicted phosphodiesterase
LTLEECRPVAQANDARPIRLLHLSDIHFRADKACDAEPVRRDLARFVGREVERGLTPDLVVITGDLAFSGTDDEYAMARAWLEDQLWPVLTSDSSSPLPRERLLLVPGNHDANRQKISRGATSIQKDLLSDQSQDLIAEILGDAGDRTTVIGRHQAYLSFYGDWLGAPQALPWWQRALELHGQRLHIAGLDSAWMACGDADRGRLLLGRYQINQTVGTKDAEAADWRLALLHHPWAYFAEFDELESRETIHLHCHLLLRGHLHEPEAFRAVPPDPQRACLELAAGCVYEHGRYPNAFQWIELHPQPKRVRVLFRAWIKGRWAIDRNQPGCSKGEADFALAASKPAPDRSTPPIRSGDLRKYLDDLWTETGHIDIRGLVTGKPEAHRFPIEALYIELQAGGAGERASADLAKGADADRRALHPSGPRENPLRAALAQPRVVIIGDPGCGKTTFLRWVAHCLAGDRLGRDPQAAARRLGLPRAHLPILVSLADWLDYIEAATAKQKGPDLPNGAEWLTAYLGARARDANQGLEAEDFRRLLAADEAMLLLDGLDEAPDRHQRERVVRRIERIAQAWGGCPLVVTSRPAAYQDKAVLGGFAHTTIEALDASAIDGFLARWSRALFPDRPERAAAHHRELAGALASRREIRLLARNTVMLTALAVVHWNEKRLPEQRAELYEAIIRWLSESREQRPGREKAQRCRQLLGDLALAMQSDPQGRQVQVTRRWAAERIAHRFGAGADGEPVDRAEGFLADEEVDSGIIVRRGHQLRFWHLTFQEYLAAQALAGRPDGERAEQLLGLGRDPVPPLYRPEWRECVLLLGGVLYLQGEDKVEGLGQAVLDALGESPSRAEQARAAGLLGALIRDLDPFGYRPADPRYAQILHAAMAIFDPEQAPAIPLADRITAADALAQAGDPRLDWTLPERWVALPGGRFPMGAQSKRKKARGYDPDARDDEAPVHAVRISPLRIARFPVTVGEFATFLDDEDHRDPRWWQAGGGDEPPEPGDWEAQQRYPSRPVVQVSWYQAMAFCIWLTDRLARACGAKDRIELPADQVVRLPTEAEWEYAARGETGRRNPWGNERPDPERTNYDETKVGHLTPVGLFPGDRTLEGVRDLAGNVWEWCLDAYDEKFYTRCQQQGTPEDPVCAGDPEVPRVLRGGAFDGRSGGLRASDRGGDDPRSRGGGIGFRCVLAAPRQP